MSDDQSVMLSCRIPDGLRRQLKVAAVERGLSMADLVRLALERELARTEGKPDGA